jgi:hypothetical protein
VGAVLWKFYVCCGSHWNVLYAVAGVLGLPACVQSCAVHRRIEKYFEVSVCVDTIYLVQYSMGLLFVFVSYIRAVFCALAAVLARSYTRLLLIVTNVLP